MRIGFFAIGIGRLTSPDWIRTVATNAERLGFASLWAPEHVVLLDRYASKYPYSAGEFPVPTQTSMGDPFATLAFAAACTKTIRLGTGICLVPEHNPVVLAKTVATTDLLSKGRLILGAGIGWLEEEFQAIGVPWERRAQRTRECVAAMRNLWSEDLSAYDGEFVKFDGVRSFPKPANGKSVPVWFGGESGPALKRVADYGDGWIGFNLTADEAAGKIKRIEELLKSSRRKRSDVELAVSPYTKPMKTDDLARYRDAGVEEVVLVVIDVPRSEREMVSRMEQMARDFVEPGAKV
jgi:probable F420-dependent oxidoreductase